MIFISEGPTVGTNDFDTQMTGIQFWKGDENLRPVYEILSAFELFIS